MAARSKTDLVEPSPSRKILHNSQMMKPKSPSPSVLLMAIAACAANGRRLLEETYDLEFREPPSSRFFLIMIAQEEFAKTFILFLIKEDIILLNSAVF